MASALEGTRLKILAIIRERGPVTVEQLAQDIGLSSASIRRHLDILQRDHLVSYEQSHKQQGRPEFLYSLTEDGRESGYRNYQALLTLLLTVIKERSPAELADKDGSDLLVFLMAQVSDRLNAANFENYTSSRDDRVTRLEKALTKAGFEPQINQENGHVEVRLCNCPFRAAALCDEAVCLMDQRLIANILEVEPVRQCSIRHGDPICSYTAKLND